ncbi:MAG: protease modulator HflC [Treponema sp.]|nr:protease modulator HflC [Treponema sp.]
MSRSLKKFLIWLSVIIILLILFLFTGPFYVVNEGSQVVVTRFRTIVSTHTEAGLYIKIPFLDQVTTYPKMLLSIDGDAQRIPTKEKQYIVVDTTARWKITDPEKFYQSFQTLDNSYNKLSSIIDTATRTIITQNRLSEIVRSSNIINEIKTEEAVAQDVDNEEIGVLVNGEANNEIVSKGRDQLCKEMTVEANKLTPEYGIQVIDIVPRQIKYSDELTESVYSRMIKDRNQVAQAFRSYGEGQKASWLGKLESEKRAISSEAYRKAEEIKGQADAQAAAIYSDAYNKDPEFFNFWKSMESYKETLKGYDALYSTSMDYFDYLYSADGKR